MKEFYGEDLAYIHNEGYAEFVTRAAANIPAILQRDADAVFGDPTSS